MRKTILFTILLVSWVQVHAEFTDTAGVASMSLADCYYPDRLSSIIANPSAGASDNRAQLVASHFFLYDTQSARYNLFGYKQDMNGFNLTFLWTFFTRDNIEVRKSLSVDPDSYTYDKQNCYYISAGGVTRYGIRCGLTVKVLYYDIDKKSSNYAFGADAGLSRNIIRTGNLLSHRYSLDAAVAGANLWQPELRLATDVEKYPSTLRVSLLNKLTTFPRYDLKNETLKYDVMSFFLDTRGTTWSSGVEYRRDSYIARLGYNPRLSMGFSAGLGVDFDSFAVDYTFRPTLFSDLHLVEFAYKFGTPEEFNETPRELADYIAEEKRASRLYNSYYEKAENLFAEKKYSEAIEILNKIVVLFPERQDAYTAIEKNRNSFTASTLGKISIDFARQVSLKNYTEAYKLVLGAADVSAKSKVTAQLVSDFNSLDIPASQSSSVNALKSRFITKVAGEIDSCVKAVDYKAAAEALEKLQLIDPQGEATFDKSNFIQSEQQEYTNSLVKMAMKASADKKYVDSYNLFREAFRVSDDTAIRGQLAHVSREINVPAKPSDELYLKKCYFIAAIEFINGNRTEARNMFYTVKRINPLFDYSILEDRMIKSAVIERNLPVVAE